MSLKSKFSNFLIKITQNTPSKVFPIIFNAMQVILLYPTRISFDSQENIYRIHDGTYTLFTFEKERVLWYIRSIEYRISKLAKQYHLLDLYIAPDDLMIDCGANIGELGIWITHKGGQYLAIEPDPIPAKLCHYNVPSAKIIEKCLWNQSGSIDFYVKTDTADSSGIYFGEGAQKISKESITLDELLLEIGKPKVKILKIEAEGAEPEVIMGLQKYAHLIENIAVDAGYERGIKKNKTVNEVTKLLINRGFERKKITREYLLFSQVNKTE